MGRTRKISDDHTHIEATLIYNGKETPIALPMESEEDKSLFKKKKSDTEIIHRATIGDDTIKIKANLTFDHKRWSTTLKLEMGGDTLIAYGQHGKPIMAFLDKLFTEAMDQTQEYLMLNQPTEEDPDQGKLWD